MTTAFDTNVLSALLSGEPQAGSVVQQLGRAARLGRMVISAPVYSELLAHPTASASRIEAFLSETRIAVDYLRDPQVWRAAGLAFRKYSERRRTSRAGEPKRLLADFLVGAHASLHADCLLTLDRGRYERDFPKLPLQ